MAPYGHIFVIQVTGEDGLCFPLSSRTCRMGRGHACDIRIQRERVSDVHCLLEVVKDSQLRIRNFTDKCHTFVGGVPLSTSWVELKHMDMIVIADRSFRWEYLKGSTFYSDKSLSNQQLMITDAIPECEKLPKETPLTITHQSLGLEPNVVCCSSKFVGLDQKKNMEGTPIVNHKVSSSSTMRSSAGKLTVGMKESIAIQRSDNSFSSVENGLSECPGKIPKIVVNPSSPEQGHPEKVGKEKSCVVSSRKYYFVFTTRRKSNVEVDTLDVTGIKSKIKRHHSLPFKFREESKQCERMNTLERNSNLCGFTCSTGEERKLEVCCNTVINVENEPIQGNVSLEGNGSILEKSKSSKNIPFSRRKSKVIEGINMKNHAGVRLTNELDPCGENIDMGTNANSGELAVTKEGESSRKESLRSRKSLNRSNVEKLSSVYQAGETDCQPDVTKNPVAHDEKYDSWLSEIYQSNSMTSTNETHPVSPIHQRSQRKTSCTPSYNENVSNVMESPLSISVNNTPHVQSVNKSGGNVTGAKEKTFSPHLRRSSRRSVKIIGTPCFTAGTYDKSQTPTTDGSKGFQVAGTVNSSNAYVTIRKKRHKMSTSEEMSSKDSDFLSDISNNDSYVEGEMDSLMQTSSLLLGESDNSMVQINKSGESEIKSSWTSTPAVSNSARKKCASFNTSVFSEELGELPQTPVETEVTHSVDMTTPGTNSFIKQSKVRLKGDEKISAKKSTNKTPKRGSFHSLDNFDLGSKRVSAFDSNAYSSAFDEASTLDNALITLDQKMGRMSTRSLRSCTSVVDDTSIVSQSSTKSFARSIADVRFPEPHSVLSVSKIKNQTEGKKDDSILEQTYYESNKMEMNGQANSTDESTLFVSVIKYVQENELYIKSKDLDTTTEPVTKKSRVKKSSMNCSSEITSQIRNTPRNKVNYSATPKYSDNIRNLIKTPALVTGMCDEYTNLELILEDDVLSPMQMVDSCISTNNFTPASVDEERVIPASKISRQSGKFKMNSIQDIHEEPRCIDPNGDAVSSEGYTSLVNTLDKSTRELEMVTESKAEGVEENLTMQSGKRKSRNRKSFINESFEITPQVRRVTRKSVNIPTAPVYSDCIRDLLTTAAVTRCDEKTKSTGRTVNYETSETHKYESLTGKNLTPKFQGQHIVRKVNTVEPDLSHRSVGEKRCAIQKMMEGDTSLMSVSGTFTSEVETETVVDDGGGGVIDLPHLLGKIKSKDRKSLVNQENVKWRKQWLAPKSPSSRYSDFKGVKRLFTHGSPSVTGVREIFSSPVIPPSEVETHATSKKSVNNAEFLNGDSSLIAGCQKGKGIILAKNPVVILSKLSNEHFMSSTVKEANSVPLKSRGSRKSKGNQIELESNVGCVQNMKESSIHQVGERKTDLDDRVAAVSPAKLTQYNNSTKSKTKESNQRVTRRSKKDDVNAISPELSLLEMTASNSDKENKSKRKQPSRRTGTDSVVVGKDILVNDDSGSIPVTICDSVILKSNLRNITGQGRSKKFVHFDGLNEEMGEQKMGPNNEEGTSLTKKTSTRKPRSENSSDEVLTSCKLTNSDGKKYEIKQDEGDEANDVASTRRGHRRKRAMTRNEESKDSLREIGVPYVKDSEVVGKPSKTSSVDKKQEDQEKIPGKRQLHNQKNIPRNDKGKGSLPEVGVPCVKDSEVVGKPSQTSSVVKRQEDKEKIPGARQFRNKKNISSDASEVNETHRPSRRCALTSNAKDEKPSITEEKSEVSKKRKGNDTSLSVKEIKLKEIKRIKLSDNGKENVLEKKASGRVLRKR